jgi:hypothetical protein
VGEATHVTVNMPGPVGLLTLPVILHGSRDDAGAWTWNGSVDAPTLRPSVLTTKPDGFRCHSWISDGTALILDDTTHELRGHTVPLLDVPGPALKTCTGCGVTAIGEAEIAKRFYVRRKKSGYVGYRRLCKECNSAAAIQWRKDNPEAWAEITARHRGKRPAGV